MRTVRRVACVDVGALDEVAKRVTELRPASQLREWLDTVLSNVREVEIEQLDDGERSWWRLNRLEQLIAVVDVDVTQAMPSISLDAPRLHDDGSLSDRTGSPLPLPSSSELSSHEQLDGAALRASERLAAAARALDDLAAELSAARAQQRIIIAAWVGRDGAVSELRDAQSEDDEHANAVVTDRPRVVATKLVDELRPGDRIKLVHRDSTEVVRLAVVKRADHETMLLVSDNGRSAQLPAKHAVSVYA